MKTHSLAFRLAPLATALLLGFPGGASAAPAEAAVRADWMRGGCGVMVHWLFPSDGDIDRWTDAFDLRAFLTDFDRTGADWLVFTAGQCRGAYCSPSETFDRYCGRHTSKRDLLCEIARAVRARGKRFVVYAACDFVKDGCADHAVQKGLGWDNSSKSRKTFEDRWPRVFREWSLRLGRDCDGWWLDGLGRSTYPEGVDFPVWADACRAGNPNAAIACNPGANDFTRYGPSDFLAGETSAIKFALSDLDRPAPEGAVRHYLFPIDGYWGAFWKWPTDDWAGVGHLQATRPELFDQKALDERLARRDFVKPIYTAEELKSFLNRVKTLGGAATVNVGISPEGRLNPHSLELLQSIR